METIPPLVGILRYGDVRKTDTAAIDHVLAGIVERVCIGLPGYCRQLADDAAETTFTRIVEVHDAIGRLAEEDRLASWRAALAKLLDTDSVHGLLLGRACRLLLDANWVGKDEAGRRMSLALSPGNPALEAAAWLDGFLRGSGLVLLHDESLWGLVDEWVIRQKDERFVELLPLLRRTFSSFGYSEKRQLSERSRSGAHRATPALASGAGQFYTRRAESVIPLVARMLGLEDDA